MSEFGEDEGLDRRAFPWERHVQSAIGAIMVAAMLWVGTTIQAQSVAIARLQVQVGETQVQIAAVLAEQSKGVSATREAADIGAADGQIDSLTIRVRKLENDMARIEGRGH